MDVYQDTQVLRDAPDRQARAGIDEAAEAPRKSTTTAPQDRVSSHGSSLMVAALPRSRIGYRSSASTSPRSSSRTRVSATLTQTGR